MVTFENLMVFLTETGQFRSYSDMSVGDPGVFVEGDKFATDEEAWEKLESLIANLEPPPDLMRHKLERRAKGEGGPVASVLMILKPYPYGYEAMGGNQVTAMFRRGDGKLTSLGIGRGWQYEEPNIKVTEGQAIEAAVKKAGGKAVDWKTKLSYWTTGRPEAPQSIRTLNENKTMRLCYDVWSNKGNVLVDSVTGDVISYATASMPTAPVINKPKPSSEPDVKPVPSKVYQHPAYLRAAGKEIQTNGTTDNTTSPLTYLAAALAMLGIAGFAMFRLSRR